MHYIHSLHEHLHILISCHSLCFSMPWPPKTSCIPFLIFVTLVNTSLSPTTQPTFLNQFICKYYASNTENCAQDYCSQLQVISKCHCLWSFKIINHYNAIDNRFVIKYERKNMLLLHKLRIPSVLDVVDVLMLFLALLEICCCWIYHSKTVRTYCQARDIWCVCFHIREDRQREEKLNRLSEKEQQGKTENNTNSNNIM